MGRATEAQSGDGQNRTAPAVGGVSGGSSTAPAQPAESVGGSQRTVQQTSELKAHVSQETAGLADRILGRITSLVPAAAIEKLTTALPWLLPVGGAAGGLPVALVTWLLTRRLRRTAHAVGERPVRGLTPIGSPSEEPTFITQQTPPPPQVVRTDQQFVTIEKPNGEAQAWNLAVRELAERQPGTRDVLQTLKAWKDQILSGLDKPKAA